MSNTGFSIANQPNTNIADGQSAETMSKPSLSPDFATVLGINPALASLSAINPGPLNAGLTPPTFNLFSTPAQSMNTLPKTGFTPLVSGLLGTPTVGPNAAMGTLLAPEAADPAALVAAVNAARASVEAATGRPTMMAPSYSGSTPAVEFRSNIQMALEEHLPRLEALARAVVEGIEKAYHPQVNSNRTAQDLALLVQAIESFYNFLKDTGVGALPLLEFPAIGEEGTTTGAGSDPANANDEVVKGKLDAIVNAQYEQQRRIRERAAIVSNLLQRD